MEAAGKKLKVVIACGGTGGHLFPGIAVAQAAKARGHEVLVLISQKQIDALATQGHADLTFKQLPAVAMPPLLSLRMLKFGVRLWQAIRNCRHLLSEFKADAVLGMGGFTSLPPLYAARNRRLKTLLHESNAIPGKANRLSAKFCDLILLGMADCAKHFPNRHTQVVGTPLRNALRSAVDPAEAWRHFQLDPDKKTVLVMGGSQGARGVNDNVCAALDHLDSAQIQIIHLTGPGELDRVQRAYAGKSIQAHIAPFCQRMELAYRISTIAVSRSGASSLTELSAFGLPTVLIPFPFAADDHQTRNAEVYVRAHAAVMVQERDLTGPRLAAMINELCTDPALWESLHKNMKAMGEGDAAARVCSALEELCS